MTERRQRSRGQATVSSGRWWIVLAVVILMLASLGCSLGQRLELLARAEAPGETAALGLAQTTYTPAPTFTRTSLPPTSPTPTATWLPWPTPTATDTPIPTPTPTATATFAPPPSPTPQPTNAPFPARPTATAAPVAVAPAAASPATPIPAPTPTPGYDYLVGEVYLDHTTVPFLTGYIAIVNAQEIPIGGVKAVGVFEPGGQRHESPLSQWFFDVATAPGAVAKTGSVKFEPGGIQAGTWFIHLEDEGGTRLSEDVAINTDPEVPQWFYIKFKQPGSALASAPTPPTSSSAAGTAATGGSAATASGGWYIVGARSFYDPDWESVFVYGEAVNDTESSQRISNIVGTFYGAGGQVVADGDDIDSYWPGDVVPAGGQVPFEVALWDIQDLSDFELEVIAQASSETARQDFEFSNLDASGDSRDYCVTGTLQNPGGALEDYLVVVVVLYDDQDNVIYFDSYVDYSPQDVVGEQTLDFEVCVDPLGQEVADYDVRAWGQ